MKVYKLFVKPISEENEWGYVDKDLVKKGMVLFECEGEINDKVETFKKGVEVSYQYGTPAKVDGEECVLVSFSNVACQK